MPIVCEQYDLHFTHIPKTGGSFVEGFLRRRLGGERIGLRHASYRWLPPARDFSFRVFIVREPVSWYRSYWAYARAATQRRSAWPIWAFGNEQHPTRRIDLSGGAPRFDRFVRKMLDEFPEGFVREMYFDFMNGTTHALRTERLYDDLEWLLGAVGFEDDGLVRTRRRINETPLEFKERAVLPQDLEAELREVDNLKGLKIPYVPVNG